jgi:hypothetical protein
MSAQVQEKTAAQIAEDNVKRRQIIEGARAAFHEQGFDAASMNDIARCPCRKLNPYVLMVQSSKHGADLRCTHDTE